MNNKPTDGGPAFPYAFEHNDPPQGGFAPGMSLRDWFAGQALAGLMADSEYRGSVEDGAATCYAVADAMLRARSKPQDSQP